MNQVENDRTLAGRRDSLVNSASGLANDYLNLFNEIVMLIEQLPTMPDLFDDLLAWKPTTYEQYFARSALPGRYDALDEYSRLHPRIRARFEGVVTDLDRLATGAVASIRHHIRPKSESDPAALAAICSRCCAALRAKLEQATTIVNHGSQLSGESAQARVDRLMNVKKVLQDEPAPGWPWRRAASA